MAENIAALDPWYSRNIYTPFCYPSWTVPFFQPPPSEEDEPEDSLKMVEESNESKTIDGPVKIWSSLSQHYFQHANQNFLCQFSCVNVGKTFMMKFDGENAIFRLICLSLFAQVWRLAYTQKSIRLSMQVIMLMIQPIKMAIVPLNTKKILHSFGGICWS